MSETLRPWNSKRAPRAIREGWHTVELGGMTWADFARPMLTVAQAARKWGVSTQRVYGWIQQGRLNVSRIDSITFISARAERPQPRRPGAGSSK